MGQIVKESDRKWTRSTIFIHVEHIEESHMV